MNTRRQVLKILLSTGAATTVLFSKIGTGVRLVYAKVKKVLLPKGTDMSSLISKNPAKLDASQLDTTPMDGFDVMGQTIHPIKVDDWRLEVDGDVAQPKWFTYADLLRLPSIERNVLLICPGFFAYNGLWKGLLMAAFLTEIQPALNAAYLKFSGPKGISKKSKRFDIEEVMGDKVFLAYQVNGEKLPERHGFPLRIVAEDHYGGRWVKYVDKVTVIAK